MDNFKKSVFSFQTRDVVHKSKQLVKLLFPCVRYLLGKLSDQRLHVQTHDFLHHFLSEAFHHPLLHSHFLHLKETDTSLQNTPDPPAMHMPMC